MNMKRMRGRGNFRQGGHGGGHGGGGGGPRPQGGGNQPMNRNHVFDSIGPDMRMRGTAQQLFEKYLQLGRDATGSGDRVMAEGYFQHAEHYFRILNAMNQAQQQQGGHQGNQQGGQNRRYQGGDAQQDAYAESEAEGGVNGYDGQPMDGETRETIQ
ncbi:DUF4167 domain-containing protein [Roseomonas sp. KE2513]|nr:DUF4167 domain-containing protein [Roseomonas sp. KE2513]MBI0538857.1 DUF4167 domain-containing protein [Roseomonas sp. KE2513]